MPHILVVDDDEETRAALTALAAAQDVPCESAASLEEARSRIAARCPSLVLCDLMLPDGSGMSLLDELPRDRCQIVVATGYASLDSAIRAIRLGASDYLVKPFNMERVQNLLSRVTRQEARADNLEALAEELRRSSRFGRMLGRSRAMLSVYDAIARVAGTPASVLLTGESGTGKELAAQTVHDLSPRHAQPFVAINCGALPANLIESEMFGHERGSFTGAERDHRGFFERAHGGTLFLDEITEMPIELQVRLLRVLETRQVLRLGGTREVEVDVRIVAATNRDPLASIEQGKLRADLYHRINVFPIALPPLREREDDVVLLAEAFLETLNQQSGRALRFSEAARQEMSQRGWRGNVRELRNLVQRAAIFCEGERIDTLPLPIMDELSEAARIPGDSVSVPLDVPLDEMDRRLVTATLAHCAGVKAHAAEMLGISLKTLYSRLALGRDEQA
ncbi:sigma-54-dependent transcriptional regulator [Burkholderia gladioli]|uniref:Sigma-54-dependent Fis family transcriptional regulator n=2 Tax=Burkholderiaceae TaxID=119060 RepID=A0A0M2Q0Y3_BURGA|nr:sigma-54 dependent transcriptional regulator [Burkholderia gladioli]ATF88217.1 sigma-54-dependent Fis family transcriptional regulator [Burkholderia gladioli pv. gladioli]KKJ02060.1 Fis family transcriptional regulator [Burkholderia gladioli]MBJ9713088.1 sigma-54-dependent Fis family transcriptional regulator [Burkholderia gladioli]MBU9159569.1 sigma-54 dependent transcriptional regulator [Burkholderia gladioli]MBU9194175.1 sigma-54 dependent transcriptional regulator [Burkholderia gladioli